MPEDSRTCWDFEKGNCSRGDSCRFSHDSGNSSVCRDFKRGVCKRGENCKYMHPEEGSVVDNGKLPVCKDYQTKSCGRVNCKFLHLTVEEEGEFESTGVLPEHGGHPEPSSSSVKNICKDFQAGRCTRGGGCRFLHSIDTDSLGIYGKRARFDGSEDGSIAGPDAELIKENKLLMKQIAEVQRQLTALRQTNDTLYELNTRYRAQVKGGTLSAPPGCAPVPSQGSSSQYGKTTSQYNPTTYSRYGTSDPQDSYSQSSQSVYSRNTQAKVYAQNTQPSLLQYPLHTYSQSMYTPSTYNHSTYPQSTYSQTTYPQSTYGQSAYPQSSYGQSTYPQSTYSQSAYPQSTYGQSTYPQSTYPQSSYAQYGQTAYSQYYQSGYNMSSNAGYWNSYPQYG